MTTPSIEPGTILDGKFLVERVLGMGAMGMVLCAQHLVLQQRVAIKLMLPEYAQKPEIVRRFMREGRAAARIKSENVVGVTDVGRLDSGEPFMVMELLTGQDLEQYLKSNGPLAIPEAVDYVLQAIEAVAEAHAAGIVHRDLKPANMFVTHRRNGTACIKVLDFGISKLTEAASTGEAICTQGMLGSPLYMSPEQLRSAKDVDGRSDIWSLGVVLFQLLTGAFPFTAGTLPQICVKVVAAPPESLRALRAEVPPELEAAVLRCLEKNPDHRYASVAEFAASIAPFGPSNAASSLESILCVQAMSEPPPPVSGRLSAAPATKATLASFGNTRQMPVSETPVSLRPLRGKLARLAVASLLVIAGLGIFPVVLLSRQASVRKASPMTILASQALGEVSIGAPACPSVTVDESAPFAPSVAALELTPSAKRQVRSASKPAVSAEETVVAMVVHVVPELPIKRNPLAMDIK